MSSIRAALLEAEQRLAAAEAPRREAELLLGHVLGRDRGYLYTWPERGLGASLLERFRTLVEERAAGRPVAYLCGSRSFWTLDLEVNENVLIPRPETELLVEQALALLPGGEAAVADLGTGSGAIALALAAERPAWRLLATDASAAALEVARRNAAAAGLANVEFSLGSWCEPLKGGAWAGIVSNPPYIEEGDPHLERGDLRFEPAQALVAAEGGLAGIRAIAQQAPIRLQAGGWLLLEHGHRQGEAVRRILEREGFADVRTERDLEGRERVTAARKPGARGTRGRTKGGCR